MCNIFYRRRSDFPLSEGTGRVRIEAQGYRWSDFVDCRSCLFCIRRQYAHDAVLLCGSTGICPRLYNGGVLVNPVAKFLGGISFEIYLCHMVIYRVLEKLHLVHPFGNVLLAYIFTAVAVICGSVVFSVCAKWFLNKIETFLKERVRRVNHV